MGRYRGRLEIIADVLRVIEEGEGSRKTHVMHGANLSYKILRRYLDLVVEVGLVRVVRNSGILYRITRKGESFLERYEGFSERRERLRERAEGIERERAELERMCSVSGSS